MGDHIPTITPYWRSLLANPGELVLNEYELEELLDRAVKR
jgi:hypothetical protein